jgi:signal peptidase II
MVADMPKKSYRVVLWALAAFGLCADQASKYAVFAWLPPAGENNRWVVKMGQLDWSYRLGEGVKPVPAHDTGFQLFTQSRTNNGALFGLGNDQWWANSAFAAISLAAAGVILYWSFRKGAARKLWVCVALGLILGGTLGNLYDRLVFEGVRDFLYWNHWIEWPVFNVADCCLVCGAILLLLLAFGRPAVPAAEKGTSGAAVVAAAPQGVVRKTAV